MRLVKIRHDGETHWGMLEGEKVKLIEGTPYSGIAFTGEVIAFDETKLEAPCDATKVIAIGKNYYDHAVEMGGQAPEKPIIFMKPTTSIIPHLGGIEYPSISNRVDYECELAFVIKKTARHVKAAHAAEYILGYTCLNDVTARDLQQLDGQWIRAKGFDTFCPIGPVLTDEVDPAAGLKVQTFLNGEMKQDSTTDKLMWPVAELLEFITACMTLHPGDVVTTGTPAGIGPMQKGDEVAVVVEGIGKLVNRIV
ncbi:MAG TPA: fumarylacetoacetate hydrolase family protein [Clostridiales bacterium]|jgi:2-keto-4-pentenoate hydratase/2-oxohepta-3-ene-1,7-dioic acid hydratase in catechol pathway|nr:fumarylacetoacetate hydrolase family protein [Clostridiales bacterium]